MKPGLLVHGASAFTGPVEVAQIGIDPALLDQYAPSQTVIDWDMVKACFLPRPLDSHKGTFGRVLAVCGSVGMAGAALLAVRAAQRCGAGLVAAALPRSLYPLAARTKTWKRFIGFFPKRRTVWWRRRHGIR